MGEAREKFGSGNPKYDPILESVRGLGSTRALSFRQRPKGARERMCFFPKSKIFNFMIFNFMNNFQFNLSFSPSFFFFFFNTCFFKNLSLIFFPELDSLHQPRWNLREHRRL